MRAVYLILSLVVMFVAMLQRDRKKQLPEDYDLNGYFRSTPLAKLSSNHFFEGIYQDSIADFLLDNVGYRGYLIALKDQIDFSLFKTAHYNVVLGSDKQLFLGNHIETHCGEIKMPPDSLERKTAQCIALKAILDSVHIPMVMVMAPGKSSYYEDKLPKKYKDHCSSDNDYHQLLQKYKENNIDVIDMNVWFRKMRSTAPYPLFPRLGVHWSYYGGCVATDSLIKYIEQKLHIDLPDYHITHTRVTDQPYKTDKDAVELMNLLFPLRSDSLAYPEYNYDYQPTKHHKPKILLVGDSYIWVLIDNQIPEHLFNSDSRFWFYQRELYRFNTWWVTREGDYVNIYELLKGTEMVVFLSTEALYHRMDFGVYRSLMAQPKSMDSLLNPKFHGI